MWKLSTSSIFFVWHPLQISKERVGVLALNEVTRLLSTNYVSDILIKRKEGLSVAFNNRTQEACNFLLFSKNGLIERSILHPIFKERI
mmetsp:Transcript_8015/g.18288  ORF Transcript_8015/g.18288 Transcript_8015/m.18288 type:complete len:88 (-) Transcript_8015:643-906(-)